MIKEQEQCLELKKEQELLWKELENKAMLQAQAEKDRKMQELQNLKAQKSDDLQTIMISAHKSNNESPKRNNKINLDNSQSSEKSAFGLIK